MGLGNTEDGPLSDIIGLGLEAPLPPTTTSVGGRKLGGASINNVRIKPEGTVATNAINVKGHAGSSANDASQAANGGPQLSNTSGTPGGGGGEEVKWGHVQHRSTTVSDGLTLSRRQAQETLGQLSEAGVIRLVEFMERKI